MNVTTWVAFEDELEKIAGGISPILQAMPTLKKALSPGRNAWKGVQGALAPGAGTAVMRGAAKAAPAVPGMASRAIGAARGLASKMGPAGKTVAVGAGGVGAGVVGDHLLRKNDQQKVASELTSKGRKHIKGSNFALPGRRYPIHDKAHARNALARVSQLGSAEEKAQVRSAVAQKWPGIG